MPDPRFRVMILCSHPVQYMSPVLRRMAQHPQVDLRVGYCSLRGQRKLHMTRNSHQPSVGTFHFSRVMNGQRYPIESEGKNLSSVSAILAFGIWSDMDNLMPVLCLTGYTRASFWIAFFAARPPALHLFSERTPTVLLPVIPVHGKSLLRSFSRRHLYSLADQVVVPSTAYYNLIGSLGIPEDRITLTPYSVDNDWWEEQSSRVDSAAVRRSWGIAPEASTSVFCAKLQPWKRPVDLLRAFALATIPNSVLVFAGEGPLRSELKTEAASMADKKQRSLSWICQSIAITFRLHGIGPYGSSLRY